MTLAAFDTHKGATEESMTDPRARPTLFVPLIGIPAFLIFFLGGIAYSQLTGTRSPVLGHVPAAELADREKIPTGAFVEVYRLALCAGAYRPDGVYVHYVDSSLHQCPPPAHGRAHVSARVCDLPLKLGCGIPREAQDAIRELHGLRPTRVLLVGESPEAAQGRAMKGYASTAIALVVYVAFVAVSRKRRKGAARVAEERTWTLPFEAEEIPTRVRKLAGEDRFLVVEEGPGRLVFIQGYSENAARAWGIRKANVFPRRATLTWQSSPREPVKVTARIEEDLLWWPASLTPTMHRLARESIGATLMDVDHALRA